MRLCVFCGSSPGRGDAYLAAASELGIACARNNIEIVYGGGRAGLMGAVADAALSQGGRVIGVIPQTLVEREVAHHALTELHVVNSMHERKALMGELSAAFVALPGGFGTLEEFNEVVTWTQLQIYAKPCYLMNIDGYYDSLLAMFDHAVNEGFVSNDNRGIVQAFSTLGALIDKLTNMREHGSQAKMFFTTR